MSIYAIGDLHLSFDESVEKPMGIYGGEWTDHEEKLKKNWCETITEEDTVIIVGDISWGLKPREAEADLAWIHELPGRKILFKGNHDLWWNSISRLNSLYDDMIFMQNSCYAVEGRFICGTRGWTSPGAEDFTEQDNKIYERELLRLKMSLDEAVKQNDGKVPGDIIGVLHFPPTNDKLQGSGFTDIFAEYGVKTVVYGHLHGEDGYKKGLFGEINGVEYKLVSLDYLRCRPILI